MFAYDQAQATSCTGCGGDLTETTAVGRDDAYDAELVVCHRCAVGDRTINAFRQAPNADMAGVRIRHFDRPDFEAVTET